MHGYYQNVGITLSQSMISANPANKNDQCETSTWGKKQFERPYEYFWQNSYINEYTTEQPLCGHLFYINDSWNISGDDTP